MTYLLTAMILLLGIVVYRQQQEIDGLSAEIDNLLGIAEIPIGFTSNDNPEVEDEDKKREREPRFYG